MHMQNELNFDELLQMEMEETPAPADKISEMRNDAEKSKNPYIKIILEHLIKRISEDMFLEEIVMNSTRKIEECWKYITSDASKQKKGNCAMIEDYVVFGWAEDFFSIPDSEYEKFKIKPPAPAKKADDKKAKKTSKTKPKTKKTEKPKNNTVPGEEEEPELEFDSVDSKVDDGFVPDDGEGARIFSDPALPNQFSVFDYMG